MIRVKVWNVATGEVIYDTQPGAPDNALPTTALNGGAIQVHTQNNCSARMVAPEFGFACYPNPAREIINFEITSDQMQSAEMTLIDLTGRVVYQSTATADFGTTNGSIDVSGFKRGVYTVELRASSGIRRVKVVLE